MEKGKAHSRADISTTPTSDKGAAFGATPETTSFPTVVRPGEQTPGKVNATGLIPSEQSSVIQRERDSRSFFSHVPAGQDKSLALPVSLDPLGQGMVTVGDGQTTTTLPIGNPIVATLLRYADTPPILATPLVEVTDGEQQVQPDPRSPERKMLEKAVSPALAYDLQGATRSALETTAGGNKELQDLLEEVLFQDVHAQAAKYKNAEKRRQEHLDNQRPSQADKIRTVETVLEEMPEEVAESIRTLAVGDSNRVKQLAAEHQVAGEIEHKAAHIVRGVGEHNLLQGEGVPKAMHVASFLPELPEDVTQLVSHDQIKKIQETIAPPFQEDALRWAAATELANRDLATRGHNEFSRDAYEDATLIHKRGEEAAQADKKGLTSQDLSDVQLENGKLVNPNMETIEGKPLSWWTGLPTTPILMENKGLREGTAPEDIAHNIMTVLENNQVTNHGKHVRISPEVREKILGDIQKRVEAGEPIQFELYYTWSRMANPLEGSRQKPGLQEWAMLNKFAQVTQTVNRLYQPNPGADGQARPAVQWAVIDEARALGEAVWDLQPENTAHFRQELDTMINQMGLSQTMLLDDLGRMAEEGGEPVRELTQANYDRVQANWDAYRQFRENGGTWDQYKDTVDEKTRGELQLIRDRKKSMMRLVNPVQHHPDMTKDDLLAVYNGIMPGVNNITKEDVLTVWPEGRADLDAISTQEDLIRALPNSVLERVRVNKMTPEQRAINADLEARALHANIYSIALMGARTAMQRKYPDAIQVTITDKENKPVVFTGDPRTNAFPGHGAAVLRYTRSNAVGDTVPGKPWIDVKRESEILGAKTQFGAEVKNRYVGVVDPETGEIYYYIERPAVPPTP